ncbi:MAG: hypothetical protein A7315_13475 [Candidatus Altiarchaeales archaeon WOR_SM1_79]|nr:MAG: hypothetical protein A7315_13475 [Candidatus Altiarchaeales archaeon WOR_SM1_79]
MPGISLICDSKEDLNENEPKILESLDSMLHDERYKKEVLLNEKSYFLGCTKYNEYPTKSFENEKFYICLEGKIYGKEESLIDKELNNIAEIIFEDSNKSNEQVKEWLLNTDGEFIVFILNKKNNEIIILNDLLGHLPLYYHKVGGKFLVSREIRFIANLIGNKFDKIGIAQYLLFMHSLGERTIFKNIFRLEPAKLIKINLKNFELEIKNIYEFNFENRRYSERTIEENANNLADLFNEACKNRAASSEDFRNVLALSGGIDSRVVLASLQKNKIPFNAVTFMDANKTAGADVKIAEQLAKLFNLDWNLFNLDSPKGRDALKLLRIKNGLNYIAIRSILPFLESIRRDYCSKLNYFTGNTGMIMRDYRPSKKIKDLDDLADYVLSRLHQFPLNEAAGLVGVDKEKIINELKHYLMSFPEKSMIQKYIHFIMFGRGFTWHYEGIDRDRFYFWEATPLESPKFYIYAMNCPDKQKASFRIYSDFLLKLSPEAATIDDANLGSPFASNIYKIKGFIKSIIISIISRFPSIMLSARKRFTHRGSYKHNSTLINCLKKQINDCESICDYLSSSAVNNIINNCGKYGKLQVEILFTITSLIEDFECKKSSIEKYYDSDL